MIFPVNVHWLQAVIKVLKIILICGIAWTIWSIGISILNGLQIEISKEETRETPFICAVSITVTVYPPEGTLQQHSLRICSSFFIDPPIDRAPGESCECRLIQSFFALFSWNNGEKPLNYIISDSHEVLWANRCIYFLWLCESVISQCLANTRAEDLKSRYTVLVGVVLTTVPAVHPVTYSTVSLTV